MKKTVALLLATLFICGVGLCIAPLNVRAESLYVRKIVSVVYDDSGSMSGNKWAFANYAMQSFCGMMNSEDKLFITYMSDTQTTSNYDPFTADLSSAGIQNSVDSIRNHTNSGSTPYDSIQIAMEKLQATGDDNPNTQYWLVIITDGVFDNMSGMSEAQAKNMLNSDLSRFVNLSMPNGTKPQVTFLSIGNQVVSPDENANQGIFTYHAETASDIIDTMSTMADKISGRTRLNKSDISQINTSTIRIESSIPLLNIVLFFQNSDATVVKTIVNNEQVVDVSRDIHVSYPGYSNLQGGINVIGDSNRAMASGTYEIIFDRAVSLDDFVVLFEPALEIRMQIYINGRELLDYSELSNLQEGDDLTVSCKIYEMGTDNEISSALLPPDTSYHISITEDGNVKASSEDPSMTIDKYTLGNVETELFASVGIPGFIPIVVNLSFFPTKVSSIITVSAEFGSNVHSVKFDEISSNKDVTIVFTVYEDGEAITDPDTVKSMNPAIDVSPYGHSGTTDYTEDGKIVFTPIAANIASGSHGSIDVTVTCRLQNGAFATQTYTVLISDYMVVSVPQYAAIVKTELFNNTIGAEFYVTKDGIRLPKTDVEGKYTASLDKEFEGITIKVQTENDGTIICTPISDEEHQIGFLSWWVYWMRYFFKLPHGSFDIRLSTPWGSASSSISIAEAPFIFRLLNVYLPIIIEAAVIAFVATWIILIVSKPRFIKGAKLYVGDIRYNSSDSTHIIREFRGVDLTKFNKLKYLWEFKKTAEIVSANGIDVRADHGGRIICEKAMPWYKDRIQPDDYTTITTVSDLAAYFLHNKNLKIQEFKTMSAITNELEHGLMPAVRNHPNYIVIPDQQRGVEIVDGRRVIRKGKIIIYTIE